MKQLHWHTLDAAALAELLRGAELDTSRAVGDATVYQVQVDGRPVLAVALPGGQAVVVEAPRRVPYQRRTLDRDTQVVSPDE